jgi:DNA-binding transcriptional LysR family regulator
MDERQLRILRELGERGSVTAVAAALHITPSAVSQHLAALQRGFPVPLTAKAGRRLALTDAGRALALAGAGVSEAVARAEGSVAAFLDDESAAVSVSAFHSAGLAWFGPLLRRLASPGSPTVVLSDEDVSEADFPALTGDHDLVVAQRVPHAAWPADRLRVSPLLTEPLDVAMSVSHRLARRRRVTVADLVEEEWIAAHDDFVMAHALEAVAARAGRPLRVIHHINEFFVVAAIVRTGSVVALMPRVTMRSRDLDGVVLREIADVAPIRQIDALSRPEVLHRASVRRVLAELRAVIDERTPAGQ